MKQFGIHIKKSQLAQGSYIRPSIEDGNVIFSDANNATNFSNLNFDLNLLNQHDADLIRRYRDVSIYPTVDTAIETIVNETIVPITSEPLSIDLEQTTFSTDIKKKIREEFEYILQIFNYKVKAQDYFKNWYIDGRIFFQLVVNPDKIDEGLTEVKEINPFNIRKVINVITDRDENGNTIYVGEEPCFVYNENNFNDRKINSNSRFQNINSTSSTNVIFSEETIAYAPSGVYDTESGLILSYLHKAMRVINQLKMMENSLVIYRIARAPERRVFYVDVGGLQKEKSKQYMREFVNNFKNQISYDNQTGEITSGNQFNNILQDYFVPRANGRSTEIVPLSGGQTLGQIEDINYFENKSYQALNVPYSRLQSQNTFGLGRSTEITRDEISFYKFVNKLRNKFSIIFIQALHVHLILKGIISEKDWKDNEYFVEIHFPEDVSFNELVKLDILENRVTALTTIENFVGRYYSKQYIWKEVLGFTDEQIAEMVAQMNEEAETNQIEQIPSGGYDANPETEKLNHKKDNIIQYGADLSFMDNF